MVRDGPEDRVAAVAWWQRAARQKDAEARMWLGHAPPCRISLAYTFRVSPLDSLGACTGFDWDQANVEKNWESHRVAFWEAEEVFFNEPLLVRSDATRSKLEARHMTLGITDAGRLLFISFTVRRHLIRVISARDMTRKEAITYAHLKA